MDPRKLSTQELLQHCLDSQDQAGWTELVRRVQPVIAKVVAKSLFRRTRPGQDRVEDLVQATFEKLFDNNAKALRGFEFHDDRRFFGFLKVVASHVVDDYFRKKNAPIHGGGREEEDLDKVSAYVPSNPGLPPRAEIETLIGEIDRCLMKLSGEPNFARDYDIFWLYFRQGLTAKAIAALPGIGLEVKGVESVLLRLAHYVREKLNLPRGRRAGRG